MYLPDHALERLLSIDFLRDGIFDSINYAHFVGHFILYVAGSGRGSPKTSVRTYGGSRKQLLHVPLVEHWFQWQGQPSPQQFQPRNIICSYSTHYFQNDQFAGR